MRNVQEVLREKEGAVERVRREIEALQLVIPLLADEEDARWGIRLESAMSGELVAPATSPQVHDEEDSPAEVKVQGTEAAANKGTFSKAISHRLKRIAEPLLGTMVSSFRP